MAAERGIPALSLDTSEVIHDAPQPASGQTMLSPHLAPSPENRTLKTPTTPSSQYDGVTLHSRTGSMCTKDDVNRMRSNSANTFVDRPGMKFDPPEMALLPDKGHEADFAVADNPFAFSPGQLNKMLNPKSLSAFKALGGLCGLEKGLRSSIDAGLSLDETDLHGQVPFAEAVQAGTDSPDSQAPLPRRDTSTSTQDVRGRFMDRLRVFGDNRLPEKKAAGIMILIWRAYNDKILILLTIAAVISLGLGIYETVSGGDGVDWIEGVAICIAILIVVTVGAANDWQKERQFAKLNKRKDDREVKVIRSGKSIQISVYDVTVGDVLHLEPGDAVPADGIFIQGHSVKCDESSATGESDQMKKTAGHEVWQRIQDGTADPKLDPFIISGSKVLEGVGTYLVTSVGVNSSFGKIMMSLQHENEDTPLQVKLGRLANWIGGLGSSAAALLLLILTIKFLAGLPNNTATAAQKGHAYLDILIVAITVIVVAVPEGLPLAVTLALAFATTRMLKENNLVRVLKACETMGNATTICSDKTGTLTQNRMTVVAGTIGEDQSFEIAEVHPDKRGSSFAIILGNLSHQANQLLKASIVLNSTAFEGEDKGLATFIGSKTETALLTLAKEYLGLQDLAAERSNAKIAQLYPFDSARKCMGIVVQHEAGFRLLVKGAAEIMLSRATTTVADVYDGSIRVQALGDLQREQLNNTIDTYAQHSLRTIGMLYKDLPSWPPKDARRSEEDSEKVDLDSVFDEMTWVGVVGIHDPLREGVVEAVAQCKSSGVAVRMVTGDNVTTARAIATECGILSADSGEIVMEGPAFRQLEADEMDRVLPKLRVLARSSPEDKRILVARLKQLGETVAVTGDGTNDGPALKTADVGFSMGIAGTEVAKEASSIILLDDNFSSTITALMWGRAVNDAVKKFLQFQVTVNITAVVLTFISAVSSDNNTSVLTAVQLLWVNLIMDTLAALALATDPPTKKILDRPPQPKSEPLITINMWKMITGQAIYQLAVTLVLYFAGSSILNYGPERRIELNTIVFNTFVWMQIFNEFNNRRLDNKFNVFEGIQRNFWFQGINLIMVGGQIMIIFVGGEAFSITRLDGGQWAISILCALPCMVWAVLIRLFPDAWFEIVFNGIVRGMAFIIRPIVRGLTFLFRPLASLWRGGRRTIARARGKAAQTKYGADDDISALDEESAVATHVNTRKDQYLLSPTTSQPPVPEINTDEPKKEAVDIPAFNITSH